MCRILRYFCIVSALVFSIFMAGCESSEKDGFHEVTEDLEDKGVSGEEEQVVPEKEEQEMIYVHVCGAVKNPGVYAMEAGSRIYEALELAGGMTQEAIDSSMNQAEVLRDGEQLYVMSEAEQCRINEESAMVQNGKVNINQASKEELMTLPGIGEAKADLIIQYRETMGKFDSVEDIMEIEGIKEGVFRKIEERITVS